MMNHFRKYRQTYFHHTPDDILQLPHSGQHSFHSLKNTISDCKTDLDNTFNNISTTITICKLDYNKVMSIKHMINNHYYEGNIIVTSLQYIIQVCQSERNYFENISQNVNDRNNNVYNKLRDIQTTMNEAKAVYTVVDNYHNKVVNFKAEADNIINTILNAISNYKSECILV